MNEGIKNLQKKVNDPKTTIKELREMERVSVRIYGAACTVGVVVGTPIYTAFGFGEGLYGEVENVSRAIGLTDEPSHAGLIESSVEGALLAGKMCKTLGIERKIIGQGLKDRGVKLKSGRNLQKRKDRSPKLAVVETHRGRNARSKVDSGPSTGEANNQSTDSIDAN